LDSVRDRRKIRRDGKEKGLNKAGDTYKKKRRNRHKENGEKAGLGLPRKKSNQGRKGEG